MSRKFIVWTDASSKNIFDDVLTTTGYVIKYKDRPPFKGSNTYYGINNSRGEMQAGIESLFSVKKYCKRLYLLPNECEVEMKTDFDELANVINFRFVENKKISEKQILIQRLKKLQGDFKNVNCEEIDRRINIAHNVSCRRMRREINDDNLNGLVEFSRFFYDNPDLCVEKRYDSVDSYNAVEEMLSLLRRNNGNVSLKCSG